MQSKDEVGQGQEKGMSLRKWETNQTQWHWMLEGTEYAEYTLLNVLSVTHLVTHNA